jgi:hypothetical protein
VTFGFADGCPQAQRATTIGVEELKRLRKEEIIASHAKRLALDLECLLLSCDTAAASKWWDSAHEALANYQADIDRLYPQPHVSPLGKD